MTTWALCGARRVGADQRPDQDHGARRWCRRGSRSRCRTRGCRHWPAACRHVAGHENAAGDGVEREQQHDEAEIFGEHRVHEAPPAPPAAETTPTAAAPAPPRPARSCRSDACQIFGNSSGPAAIDSRCRRTAAPTATHRCAVEPGRRLRPARQQHHVATASARPDTSVALNPSIANELPCCPHRTIAVEIVMSTADEGNKLLGLVREREQMLAGRDRDLRDRWCHA